MANLFKSPRSYSHDDEWDLVVFNDYGIAYVHALDFVLFEKAPWFDCRLPGWVLLPNDLREAVLKEQRKRQQQQLQQQ